MHEGVGGRRGSGGGIEGGPVPRTSLAHSGGRTWEGGHPSPAPGPSLQSSSCSCSSGGGGDLAPAPPGAGRRGAGSRLRGRARVVKEPAEGRGFQRPGAPAPRRSPQRPQPLGPLLRGGRMLERGACLRADPGPAPPGVPLGKRGPRLPAGLRLGASLGRRGASGAENALRLCPGVEVTLSSTNRGGALGRMRMEGRARSARRPAARGRGGAHHLSEADHLSFLVGSTPSRVDLRRSRPLAAVLCLTALGIRVLPELGRAACFGVRTPSRSEVQDAGHTFTRAQPGLDGQCEPENLG